MLIVFQVLTVILLCYEIMNMEYIYGFLSFDCHFIQS